VSVHSEGRWRRPQWLGSGDGKSPGQQATREGSMRSREGAWTVARPWEAEGGRSSTAAARMARWGYGVSARGKRQYYRLAPRR
jgi:hypothetical protein